MLNDPTQLRLLALVRACGSLSGAAADLGLTTAAVSGQLARAERDWATALVVRGPRGARLTEAGHLLADAGDVVVEQGRLARERVTTMLGQLNRRLRIGTFQSAAQHLVPAAMTALRHQHRDAELTIVEITSDRGIDLVDSGQVDVAVVASYGRALTVPANLRATALLTDPMVVCLPDDHPLIRRQRSRRALRLNQLADAPWIVIVAGHAARRQFDQAATEAGFAPRVQFETENYNVAQSLVATGIGVTMLSRLTVAPTPGAVHRDLAAPLLDRQLHAITTTTCPRLVNQFVTLLVKFGRDLEEAWTEQPLNA